MEISVGFIGLGLIGGSIAKALKKADPAVKTVAYNRSKAPLEQAVSEGVIDVPAAEVDETFCTCDMIFLCTPVEYNSVYLSKVAPFVKKDCILTDVGSVKGYIHQTVESLGLSDRFIGGHPMAGSEKTGYAASNEFLLENAYYAITPTEHTSKEALERYIQIVKMTGAVPIVVDPKKHDYAVAGISHVPHLIAAGLVNVVRENDTEDELMKLLAAGGFKDITRIASSSAEMWSQICSANQEQILNVLTRYIDYMNSVKEKIAQGDSRAIHEMFAASKEYRDAIGQNKGLVLPSHTMYCDIEDKEGAISTVTTLLSDFHLNIKNIEIVHNREYKQGVLFIEFYDDASAKSAHRILRENGYIIYK